MPYLNKPISEMQILGMPISLELFSEAEYYSMVPIWMVLLDCHVKKINSMYKIQFVMFCFLLVAVANAQPDTTRIDTSWSRSPHRPFLLSSVVF